MSNFITGSKDLSTIFQSYSSGTKAATTNFITSTGSDLSDIYAPYVSGTKASATNFITSTGSDLSDLFAPISAASTPLLVSSLTTASSCNGCYSTKLLVTGYTGYIIKIRRLSDGTFMSFYSNSSGNLTSNADGTGTTIATFLTSTTGYVDTWYDQSGKGNHATQTTTSSQPIYDKTNNLIDFGYSNSQNLTMNIPSGTVPVGVLDASYSFVVKHGLARNISNGGFIASGIGNNNQANNFRLNGTIRSYWNYWYANDFGWSDTVATVPIISSVTYSKSSKTQIGYVNGAAKQTTTDRTGCTNASAVQKLGTTVSNEFLRGQIYSVIIFSEQLPSSDITILNSL